MCFTRVAPLKEFSGELFETMPSLTLERFEQMYPNIKLGTDLTHDDEIRVFIVPDTPSPFRDWRIDLEASMPDTPIITAVDRNIMWETESECDFSMQ